MKFKDYLIVCLKGILIGLLSMGVPGVSASTTAIIIGIYFVLVENIATLFKNFKKNILFLISLMIGYGIGAILAAFSVTIIFEKFPLVTALVITSIIFASIVTMSIDLKDQYKKVSNWITFFCVLAFLCVFNFVLQEGASTTFPTSPTLFQLIKMAFIGLITSSTFIIPGIDFAVVFLSLGIYYPFMNMLMEIVSFGMPHYLSRLLSNLQILGFYLIGYFIGIFLFSKVVKYLTSKYKSQTDFASFAFVVAAPAIFLRNCVVLNNSFHTSLGQYIVGIILAVLSFIGIILFNKVNKKKTSEIN